MVAKETMFTTIPLTESKSKLFVYNWLPQKYVLEEMDCVPKRSLNEMETREPWHNWERTLLDSYKLISKKAHAQKASDTM